MSEEFQDRLEENEVQIREELELEEEDSKFIWDNITEFCEESDKEVLEDIIDLEEEKPEEKVGEKEKEIEYVKEDEAISKKKKKKRDSQKASEIVCTMSHEEFIAMTKKVIKKVFIKLKYTPKKKRKKEKKKKQETKEEKEIVVETS